MQLLLAGRVYECVSAARVPFDGMLYELLLLASHLVLLPERDVQPRRSRLLSTVRFPF